MFFNASLMRGARISRLKIRLMQFASNCGLSADLSLAIRVHATQTFRSQSQLAIFAPRLRRISFEFTANIVIRHDSRLVSRVLLLLSANIALLHRTSPFIVSVTWK